MRGCYFDVDDDSYLQRRIFSLKENTSLISVFIYYYRWLYMNIISNNSVGNRKISVLKIGEKQPIYKSYHHALKEVRSDPVVIK